VNLPGLQVDRVHIHAGRRRILSPPRVLLADDHHALLKAEIALLSADFDVVGTASDGAALVSEACRLHPDVIVTDISMPILNGIDAVHKLWESGSTAKLVFVTVHSEGEFVEACMAAAGALGYVQKLCLNHDLVPAIKAVLAGRSYVSQFDSRPSRKHAG
jgi:DNA-binding NarL/FixJ family response regulator